VSTFLVTAKMSPALRARVEAAVRGKRADRHRRWPRLAIAAGVLVALVMAGVSVASTRRQASEALEARKSRLLETHRERIGEGALDMARVEQTRALLLGLAGPYEGDWAADSLKGSSAAALLARPTLYIRAPLESFESELTLGHAAEASFRDAFALCLHAPPDKRSDRALAGRAKAIAAGGAAQGPIAHIDRVHDALAGMRFLSSDWEARVRAAETEPALVKLSEALREAPIEATLRASQAELVLVVADEEKVGDGPTELDGACPHFARIFLFDAKTAAPLARLRRFVDPSKLPDDVRIAHANGVNGCQLALEARAAWGLPVPP
jgi:hypothetical protein